MRMSAPRRLLAAVSVMSLLLLIPATQLRSVSANQQESATQSEQKPRAKARGRVPNGFGKLGLTDKQREEIYSIQDRYRSEVETLQQQLDELKLQEFNEVQNVLSDEQKEAYRKYLEQAAKSRKRSDAE